MPEDTFLYLHGLASSPSSTKALYFAERFRERRISLTVLDGNQGGFSTLTLTRIIEQVSSALLPDRPTTVIGSSFGGLAAAWAAEKFLEIHRLVLLAPAFEFCDRWLPRLGETQIRQWQTTGSILIYHYGEKRSLALNYSFVEDLSTYSDLQLQRQLPTLILHGKKDDVIGIESSRNYAASRPWVQLIEVESDHALTDVLPELWQEVQEFCF